MVYFKITTHLLYIIILIITWLRTRGVNVFVKSLLMLFIFKWFNCVQCGPLESITRTASGLFYRNNRVKINEVLFISISFFQFCILTFVIDTRIVYLKHTALNVPYVPNKVFFFCWHLFIEISFVAGVRPEKLTQPLSILLIDQLWWPQVISGTAMPDFNLSRVTENTCVACAQTFFTADTLTSQSTN